MGQTEKLQRPTSVPLNKSKTQSLPHIRSDRKRSGNLLMNVSIGTRLTLSFILRRQENHEAEDFVDELPLLS